MAQTTDGYIWIGTRAGVIRFDGVRFVPLAPSNGQTLHSNRILSLRGVADRPEMPVVFLTFQRDVRTSVRAMKAGAVDYLTKPFNDSAVLSAIESAVERSRDVLHREASLLDLRKRNDSLSSRERQVMQLVVRGLLNKQIAAELDISEITVKVRRGKVMQKMAADSLPDLVNRVRKLDLHADEGIIRRRHCRGNACALAQNALGDAHQP